MKHSKRVSAEKIHLKKMSRKRGHKRMAGKHTVIKA